MEVYVTSFIYIYSINMIFGFISFWSPVKKSKKIENPQPNLKCFIKVVFQAMASGAAYLSPNFAPRGLSDLPLHPISNQHPYVNLERVVWYFEEGDVVL